MARIRTVKPELWDDEIVGTWSRDARLLFIGTWNLADDEGVLRWQSAYLKSSIFKYDDDLSVGDVEKLMAEIADSERVFVYTAGKTSQRLAYIVNFRKHQVINRPGPGPLPPPPIGAPEVLEMYARRDAMVCHPCKEIIDVGDEPGALPGLGQDLALVHMTPRSEGGTDHPSNVWLAHLTCKNNPTLLEAAREAAREASRKHSRSDSVNGSRNSAKPKTGRKSSAGTAVAKAPGTKTAEPNVGDIVAAFVEGATDSGQDRPGSAILARVGRQARQLLGEGKDISRLIDAARTMGAGEWNDLAVQLRKDDADRTGARSPGRSTTNDRVAMARQAAAAVQARVQSSQETS